MSNFDPEETHPSWATMRANRVTSSPGAVLFDSEIHHREFVAVTLDTAVRRRGLHRDWIHSRGRLVEVHMSLAQWGAFVSSFGDGSGVPVTLDWFNGEQVDDPPDESRLALSHAEVLSSATDSVADLRAKFADVEAAHAQGGKRAMGEALRSMRCALDNAPKNMEFAAKQLTTHAENVVTKARADIEAMVLHAATGSDTALPTPGDVLALDPAVPAD